MIFAMGGIFAQLFGWFFGLVGEEVKAEIQRKKAAKAKKARLKKKKEKAAAKEKARQQKLKLKRAREKEVERLRKEKSERVQADLQRQIDRLCDLAAPPDPYVSADDVADSVNSLRADSYVTFGDDGKPVIVSDSEDSSASVVIKEPDHSDR